ncbi:hypothetical protein BZA77DRAFT_308331 [Pyronema omphalodes]|nr:hypothetical protein BZA77DRAFT_308331 [Pyronema omphalodes]
MGFRILLSGLQPMNGQIVGNVVIVPGYPPIVSPSAGSAVYSPISLPTRTPTTTQVNRPVSLPIRAPITTPVNRPVTLPTLNPTKPPAQAPIRSPIAGGSGGYLGGGRTLGGYLGGGRTLGGYLGGGRTLGGNPPSILNDDDAEPIIKEDSTNGAGPPSAYRTIGSLGNQSRLGNGGSSWKYNTQSRLRN